MARDVEEMHLFAVRFANTRTEFVVLAVSLVCREQNGSAWVKDIHPIKTFG